MRVHRTIGPLVLLLFFVAIVFVVVVVVVVFSKSIFEELTSPQ